MSAILRRKRRERELAEAAVAEAPVPKAPELAAAEAPKKKSLLKRLRPKNEASEKGE